jgi:hypothetical protein
MAVRVWEWSQHTDEQAASSRVRSLLGVNRIRLASCPRGLRGCLICKACGCGTHGRHQRSREVSRAICLAACSASTMRSAYPESRPNFLLDDASKPSALHSNSVPSSYRNSDLAADIAWPKLSVYGISACTLQHFVPVSCGRAPEEADDDGGVVAHVGQHRRPPPHAVLRPQVAPEERPDDEHHRPRAGQVLEKEVLQCREDTTFATYISDSG